MPSNDDPIAAKLDEQPAVVRDELSQAIAVIIDHCQQVDLPADAHDAFYMGLNSLVHTLCISSISDDAIEEIERIDALQPPKRASRTKKPKSASPEDDKHKYEITWTVGGTIYNSALVNSLPRRFLDNVTKIPYTVTTNNKVSEDRYLTKAEAQQALDLFWVKGIVNLPERIKILSAWAKHKHIDSSPEMAKLESDAAEEFKPIISHGRKASMYMNVKPEAAALETIWNVLSIELHCERIYQKFIRTGLSPEAENQVRIHNNLTTQTILTKRHIDAFTSHLVKRTGANLNSIADDTKWAKGCMNQWGQGAIIFHCGALSTMRNYLPRSNASVEPIIKALSRDPEMNGFLGGLAKSSLHHVLGSIFGNGEAPNRIGGVAYDDMEFPNLNRSLPLFSDPNAGLPDTL